MQYAVFSCMGLGDGLISLILSHNLVQAGHSCVTYHPFLAEIQPFFPHLPIFPRPVDYSFLEDVDHLFIFVEKLPWMSELLRIALQKYREKTTVLNPIATPNRDYPFWDEGKFDGNRPFVTNLQTFCEKELLIEGATKENGLVLPDDVRVRRFPQRVILHPTSSRVGKNWSKSKYLQLAKLLEKQGYQPVFLLTEEEQKGWLEVEAPPFANLLEVTKFVAESGSMIGNDSGIGHLASNVGVPTLTICRSRLAANFWRPNWAPGKVLFPPRFIPNLKGMRWRDKKWQRFISVTTVWKAWHTLLRDFVPNYPRETAHHR